jgi:branched-subunit amino acid ABC-type transport system permease component
VRTVLINGAFVGMIYGVLGVGLVVVYRGSRVINFAQGETGMLGAFVFAELWLDRGVTVGLALLAGVSLSAVLGALTELLVVRPMRRAPRLNVMVATFGVANLILVYAARRYGLNPRFVEPVLSGSGPRVAGLTIQPMQLVILAVALLLLVGLALIYNWSSMGLRLRATALDPDAAGQVGVNVTVTSVFTWGLAGGISGLCALLISPLVAFHVFFMTSLMLRALTAALIGGLTNVQSVFAAGVLIGLLEGFLGYQYNTPGFVEFALAALVLLLLVVRPTGLVRAEY